MMADAHQEDRRGETVLLAALFGAALLIRLWPFLAIRQSWEDAYFYIELARSLSGGRWELLGQFHTKYMPGYPMAITAAHTVLFGLAGWFKSAQFVSLISSSLCAPLAYIVGREAGRSRTAGLAAGTIAVFSAHLFVNGGIPFSEALFSCQVMAVLVLVFRYPVLAGLIAGWAAVTRHEGWFLALPFVVSFFSGERKGRVAAGLVIMLVLVSWWWLLCRLQTGAWLYEVYTRESAERAPEMGRPGLNFVYLSLPVAGHLVTALSLVGIPRALKNRTGIALLSFAVPYLLLHMWWMFPVNRYFVPLVAPMCVLAGVGVFKLGSWTGRATGANTFRTAILLALIAGITHFAGFGPGLVKEEKNRTLGYRLAAEFTGKIKKPVGVLAYDVFLVNLHDGTHPVFPTGPYTEKELISLLFAFYLEQEARLIIWSDLYPADRQKSAFSSGKPFSISGESPGRSIVMDISPMRHYEWTYYYPEPGYLRPWYSLKGVKKKALVFGLSVTELNR